MTSFKDIKYLKEGSLRQREAFSILNEKQILQKLEQFQPILTGTIPINIYTPESDLDIICYWDDKMYFIEKLKTLFSTEENFTLQEVSIAGQQTIIASFIAGTFEFEIFGQNVPTPQQNAYLHMLIEYKILEEKGETFRKKIIGLKRSGLKTEPAFAQLLQLEGDPYTSLLQYTTSEKIN
ncbi:MAG: DUF4269 domain-containing protein [Pedobacter sp.]|nr:MAG: DUF4269 domain-containing protein [Pedobacter sp.]